jgi:protein-disulfide isomerase
VLTGCQRVAGAGGSTAADTATGEAAAQQAQPDDLTPREQRDWRAYLVRFPSPCPQAEHSIAECLAQDRSCAACRPAAEFVAASIRAGHAADQVEARYMARFDPARVRLVPLEGAPSMGPADAVVTIVEFADFECPFCAAAVPLIDKIAQAYAPHVRVAFRNFPIKHHEHAGLAARAAMAAHAQGKFWQMHHELFGNRTALERPDIERYARSVNLDLTRFVRDLDSPEVAQAVRSDYQTGSQVGVSGTPTFFINGREFSVSLFDFGGEDLLSWIELEIRLATGKRFGAAGAEAFQQAAPIARGAVGHSYQR